MSFSAIALVGAGIALVWALIGLWLARRHEARPAPDGAAARQAA
jgi:hypothetical protein